MGAPVRQFLLKLALEEAIRREEQAYWFYQAAMASAQEPASRELLRSLGAEELRHWLKLQELKSRKDAELVLETSSPREASLLEPEKPLLFRPGQNLRAAEIWRTAMVLEQRAYGYYRLLARKAALHVLREAFRFLSAEEARHVEWIRSRVGQ